MKKGASSIQVVATLDRFEGDFGVVYLGEESKYKLDIPRHYLPAGVQEGTHLKIIIERDDASTQETRSRILKFQQDLLNKNK